MNGGGRPPPANLASHSPPRHLLSHTFGDWAADPQTRALHCVSRDSALSCEWQFIDVLWMSGQVSAAPGPAFEDKSEP